MFQNFQNFQIFEFQNFKKYSEICGATSISDAFILFVPIPLSLGSVFTKVCSRVRHAVSMILTGQTSPPPTKRLQNTDCRRVGWEGAGGTALTVNLTITTSLETQFLILTFKSLSEASRFISHGRAESGPSENLQC